MKQQPIYRTLSLALACWLCTGSLLHAREYADLFDRHAKRRHGETHARLTADLLILGRSNSAPSIPILVANPDGGPTTPLLNTTDLELDAYVSGRYDLILTDDSDYELQFTLTGFPSGHQAKASRTDPDITAVLFGGISIDNLETFHVKYVSKFGSGELNLRRRLGSRATWFSGFRYIALQEDLDFIDENNEGLFADTDNALYGFQVGIESTVWTNGKARIDVTGRSGVFYNHIDLSLQSDDPDDSDKSLIYKRQTDKAAFASDLQATLFVPLGPGSLRLGYQLFYVNKAAFVPNQLDSVDFINDTGSIELSSPVYHGGFLGLEVPF